MKKIIYKILRYFNYILIFALLLSYLSVFVNPGKIWLLAFFGLAYPFLLLANIIFIIFWLSKKKRFFIIPLIAILIGWSYLSSLVQIPLKGNKNKKPAIENSFNILSYNVRLFDLYDWDENENTTERIFNFINKANPDFICFQEFHTKNKGFLTEESIKKSLNQKYYTHIDYTIENDNFNYGIATFSRFQIVNRGVIQFNNSSNSSIYTDVIIDNDTIRIFNNHLQSIRFYSC